MSRRKGISMTIPIAVPRVSLLARLMRGFSDPSRLTLLVALRSGPTTVSELVQQTGLTQSNVSNHLSCLRDCGLVVCEQKGRFVFYQLSDPRVASLLTTAEELVGEVATGVEACPHYQVDEGEETG
jgi:ArsR family transcriptional regulator, cadmium/lead-responsive transcriptional repressor